jgi:hypothetical protein
MDGRGEFHVAAAPLGLRAGRCYYLSATRSRFSPPATGVAGTEEIMNFLAGEISPNTYVNIMVQYYPAGKAAGDALIGRRISRAEFDLALQAAGSAGLQRLDGERI